MSQALIDDVTGQPILGGRSYRIQEYQGGQDHPDAIDVVDVEHVLSIIRDRLTAARPQPAVQIVVKTWTHTGRGLIEVPE